MKSEQKRHEANPLLLPRFQSNMAQEVLDTIMNIQPKDSSGGSGETRESIVFRIADDMLEKLPPDYIPHEVCTSSSRHVIGSLVLFSSNYPADKGSATEDGCPVLYEYLPAAGD